MKCLTCGLGLVLALGSAGCGGDGDGGPDPVDMVAWVNLAVGTVHAFDVDIGVTVQEGEREVEATDSEYRDGVTAYRVVCHQSGFEVATRWYQVAEDGLFLLGEEVKEGTLLVPRTFETPVKILPYPIEDERGDIVISWSTTSELEEGGSETHRYDNAGVSALTVPAGTFQAWHLVHTRTDSGGGNHQYDEYFVEEEGFVQFEYPEDQIWSQRPATP